MDTHEQIEGTQNDAADQNDDARLEFELKRQKRIDGCYEAARKAIELARKFAAEALVGGFDHRDDRRVRSCLAQVLSYRQQIARVRAMRWEDVDTVLVVALAADLAEVA